MYKTPYSSNFFIDEYASTSFDPSTNTGPVFYLKFTNGYGFLTSADGNEVQYENYVDLGNLALSNVSDTDRYPVLTSIRRAISDLAIYDYFDTTPTSLIRKPMLPTSEKRLLPIGENLAQLLNTIKINDKSVYTRIVEMLHEVNPNFTGFDYNFIGGNIELMLEEAQLNRSIHVSRISDGTLRYLCLLAILFNPQRGKVICIDEPEIGLHPDMISGIAQAIIEASKKSLIIISTHSEHLLNAFEIETIRVFEKDNHNATTISQYEKKDFESWYDEFSVGKMWRQGDLGGNRW
jgi:predicted ATPase